MWLLRFIVMLSAFGVSLELLRLHYGPTNGPAFQLVVLLAALPLPVIACLFEIVRTFKERAELLRAHDAKMKAEMESMLEGNKKREA
jgi:hypothetical protein